LLIRVTTNHNVGQSGDKGGEERGLCGLCNPIEKIVVISRDEQSFTFDAYLKFTNKKDSTIRFEPVVRETWDISFLPMLNDLIPGRVQLQQGHC